MQTTYSPETSVAIAKQHGSFHKTRIFNATSISSSYLTIPEEVRPVRPYRCQCKPSDTTRLISVSPSHSSEKLLHYSKQIYSIFTFIPCSGLIFSKFFIRQLMHKWIVLKKFLNIFLRQFTCPSVGELKKTTRFCLPVLRIYIFELLFYFEIL